MILLTGSSDSYAQLLTVLFVFAAVLAVTALTTKWIAGYQKQQNAGSNIEVLESARIGNNKFVQIIRVGTTYMAVAVCKDTVTMLGEVPEEQLRVREASGGSLGFRELLERTMKKASSKDDESETENHEDEAG